MCPGPNLHIPQDLTQIIQFLTDWSLVVEILHPLLDFLFRKNKKNKAPIKYHIWLKIISIRQELIRNVCLLIFHKNDLSRLCKISKWNS